MQRIPASLLLTVILTLVFSFQSANAKPLRGYNVNVAELYDCYIAKESGQTKNCTTLEDAKASGATLVRLSFSKIPLMNQRTLELAQFDEKPWIAFHKITSKARQLGLAAIIDPHAMPGAAKFTSLSATDEFWDGLNSPAQVALLKLWRTIAWQSVGYGDAIYAFDLINEPYDVPAGANLNAIYRRLVRTIRNIDPDRTLILDFHNQSYYDVVEDTRQPLNPRFYDPGDKGVDGNAKGTGRLLYSTHFYWPLDYTHQGIRITKGDGSVKDRIANRRWPSDEVSEREGLPFNKSSLEKRLTGVKRFAQAHGNWRMFIGEFSTSACPDCGWDTSASTTAGLTVRGGDQWLSDVVSIFRREQWSWAYHSLNGADFWEATKPAARLAHVSRLLRQ